MGADALDPSIVQDHDLIRIPHRGNALGDDDLGHIRQLLPEHTPDLCLRGRIHGTGGIIQNQHLGFL